MIRVDLPIKLESLANKREHWSAKARRAKSQRHAAYYALEAELRKGGRRFGLDAARQIVVTITRRGPRMLDSDNLAISGKHVRDGIADALGVDDGSPGVRWEYQQEKQSRAYSVRVEVSTVGT